MMCFSALKITTWNQIGEHTDLYFSYQRLTWYQSGFFRDMLCDSKFTSSVDNPITLEEGSWRLKTVLLLIAGHPCAAMKHCSCWLDAQALYLTMQKYQLDRLRPWFSKALGQYAYAAPLETLCLACSNPCFDEELARHAILLGMAQATAKDIFNPEYFVPDQATKSEQDRKRCLLHPFNTKAKLSIDLGSKGYSHTAEHSRI
jgi:hypothetical protein